MVREIAAEPVFAVGFVTRGLSRLSDQGWMVAMLGHKGAADRAHFAIVSLRSAYGLHTFWYTTPRVELTVLD